MARVTWWFGIHGYLIRSTIMREISHRVVWDDQDHAEWRNKIQQEVEEGKLAGLKGQFHVVFLGSRSKGRVGF